MPYSVDHGLSLIPMSISYFSRFDISIRIISIMAAVLKVFSCYLLPEPKVGWSGNLVEGIGAAWRFRIAKMVSF